MPSAIDGSVGIVAYIALFSSVGLIFVFANLLIGRLLRPRNPNEEKLEIYECGEPAIGSSFVQFDLRFYVVALIFIVFDVEVAFLFPWATVFGKANELAYPDAPLVATADAGKLELTPLAQGLHTELGFRNPTVASVASEGLAAGSASEPVGDVGSESAGSLRAADRAESEIRAGGKSLLTLATVEILVFFVILLIAFVYEWKLGALDWVRAMGHEHADPVRAKEQNASSSGVGKPDRELQPV